MSEKTGTDLFFERIVRSVALFAVAGVIGKSGYSIWGCGKDCIHVSAIVVALGVALVIFLLATYYVMEAVADWFVNSSFEYLKNHSKGLSQIIAVLSSLAVFLTALVVWDEWRHSQVEIVVEEAKQRSQ